MAEKIRQLLKLHNEGKISNSALDNALKALQPAQQTTQQDGKETVASAVEELRTKRREKKKRQKQRRAKARAEATAAHEETQELAETAEASQNLKLVEKPLSNYFKTYEINAEKYKDPSVLFVDKKSTIIDQLKEDLIEYNGNKILSWPVFRIL